MARKLEKVEKELGYCNVKLEKERRLRKQIEYMEEECRGLRALIGFLRTHEIALSSVRANEVPSRESFLSMGLLELSLVKQNLIQREQEELQNKLRYFTGFEDKKKTLEIEKKLVLRKMPSARFDRVRRANEEFKRTEYVWNDLSENLLNLDEAIFCVQRSLDYLDSCRNFLLSAKSNYRFDTNREGFLTELFRHSSLGRALEMADGADRNLELSERELACVSGMRFSSEAFVPTLVRFADALYEDLFVIKRLRRTVQTTEAGIAVTLKLLKQLKRKRENLADKLESTEKVRDQLFSRMGKGRRREMAS